MSVDLMRDGGTPVEQQRFTWQEMMHPPYSKLDTDAFTRVRVIVMSALEQEAVSFSHACARGNRELQRDLALIRRIEQHQRTLLGWLTPSDQSPLENAVAHEQAAIELTAACAAAEPNAYFAQLYRFGLLEDVDQLYRFAALLDRVEGKDANTLLQSYTDILPGRPAALAHRHPHDDVRSSYQRESAALQSKLQAYTMVALKAHTLGYYLVVGPSYADPLGRQLYAELASIEEQHVTQYESIIDATESCLEKWLLHEASEVLGYHGCLISETEPRMRRVWERFLDYELGQLRHVAALFERHERRDAAEILGDGSLCPPAYGHHRELIRRVLRSEVQLTASGANIIPRAHDPLDSASRRYRESLHVGGCAAERVAAGYMWSPGTELARQLPHTTAAEA